MSALLKCDGVSMHFAGVKALDEVSLEVSAGQVIGLVGPNGSGKTTMINCISGLLKPTFGTVSLIDQEMQGKPAYVCCEKGIARTFQNLRLFGGLTVRENLLIGGHLHGSRRKPRSAARTRAAMSDGLMELLGITQFAGRRAGSLAYGIQRRVEIARAMMTEPKLVLLDEPAAGMNHVEADELGDIFRGIAQQGVGVLLVEHNVAMVSRVTDMLYVLDAGKNLASGDPAETMADPRVVKAYLG